AGVRGGHSGRGLNGRGMYRKMQTGKGESHFPFTFFSQYDHINGLFCIHNKSTSSGLNKEMDHPVLD
ncbi:MAG: hypothetical protein II627_05330, partial [Lachnospiraceae bacterium]|nr:hypothetical protein [Lachnospiraceae bacterium]